MAWDGNTYVWPPPKSWRPDSADIWWAPGTGPSPSSTFNKHVRVVRVGDSPIDESEELAEDNPTDESEQPVDHNPTDNSEQPTDHNPTDNSEQPNDHNPTDNSEQPTDHNPTDNSEQPNDHNPTDESEEPAYKVRVLPRQPPSLTLDPPKTVVGSLGGPGALAAMLFVVALAAVALFGGLQLMSSDQDSQTGATGQEGSTTTVNTKPEADDESDSDLKGSASTTSRPSDEEPEVAQDMVITTRVDRPLATAENNDRVISRYRTLVAAQDITTDQLTDDDVIQFANSSCAYAIVSADQSEYAIARDVMVDSIDNKELTSRQMRFAIDAAVAVFCPEEATRINLRP